MITKIKKLEFEYVLNVYQQSEIALPKEWQQTTNESIRLILNAGAQALLNDEDFTEGQVSEAEDMLSSLHGMTYSGPDKKMHLPYILPKSDSKKAAVRWAMWLFIPLIIESDNEKIVALALYVANFLKTQINLLSKLTNFQKCVFFRVYYLYEINNKTISISQEMLENFSMDEEIENSCFISQQINCDKKIKNKEEETLCGVNFCIADILKELLELHAIKEQSGGYIPYAYFI